jgi:AcrR family transcriptional regulator
VAYRRTPQIQARLDAQRTALLDAAGALLGDRGYAACSISAVAARAGISTGSVYTHFPSKSVLVADVFRTVVGREVEAVRAAVAAEPYALDRVRAVIETFAGRALKQPRRAYALLAEPVDPIVDELRLQFRLAFRDVLAGAVADGVATGELPHQHPAVVAAALVGAIAEALVGPLADGVDDPDTVPALINFAHRAVGGLVHATP